MRLISYTIGNRSSYGEVLGSEVSDLQASYPHLRTLREFIASKHFGATDGGKSAFRLEDVTYLPVIGDADKIICVGLNYHDHAQEFDHKQTGFPPLFVRFPASQVGHAQPIVKPRESEHFDYEGELAVIIGTGGRRIPEARALDHIAGYSCFNDGSVRDWQQHNSQFLPGKVFERSGSFGPWMVTADEIPDPASLLLTTRLNGAVVQQSRTDMLIHSVPRLIAYCSTMVTLLPGDVIVSGTPGGVGAKRTPPLWMRPGDTVEVEISSIRVLRNMVVEG